MRALQEYAELLTGDGPWCTIHAEVSTGTVDTLEATEVLGGNLARMAAEAGAGKEATAAIERITWSAEGVPAPVSRFVLVQGGDVVMNEVLPAAPAQPLVRVGPIPDLIPLAEHLGGDALYLEVEVERADAEMRLQRASLRVPVAEQELHGSTENLSKVPSGGWSQGRYQRRTEEIWRRNGAEVAAEVDRRIEDAAIELVVLSGDERAVEKVRSQLGERAASLTRTVAMNSAAAGADRERYAHEVQLLLDELVARRQAKLLERMKEGGGTLAARGWGEVVRALQEARVDTLFLSPPAVAERTILALGAAPWLASTDTEALSAPVLGQADPASALVRAAVLTDADTVLVPTGVLDGGEAAALLRWE